MADPTLELGPTDVEGLTTQNGELRAQLDDTKTRLNAATTRGEDADDLLMEAWGVIANAHGGQWDEASDEWRAAATRWRDRWHSRLS